MMASGCGRFSVHLGLVATGFSRWVAVAEVPHSWSALQRAFSQVASAIGGSCLKAHVGKPAEAGWGIWGVVRQPPAEAGGKTYLS